MKASPWARIAVPFVFVSLAGAPAESAADWPQFLGNGGSGVSSETGLIEDWPQDGPRELWRAAAEGGMSGVAISRGLAVTMTQHDGRQHVLALDAVTGESKWEMPVADAYQNQMGDGPRATPSIGGDAVFAYSGDGVLVALKVSSGEEIWRREAIRENRGRIADYGTAGSPLIVDGNVIVIVGAPGPTVAAYDQRTGEPAWTSGEDPAGYSSPSLQVLGGRKQIVVFSGNSAWASDPPTARSCGAIPTSPNSTATRRTPSPMRGSS